MVRPRLLAALLARFEQRVLTLVAPAGYGKTTLLTQAYAENALVPRGVDVWVTCEPADADEAVLADAVLAALCRDDEESARRTAPAGGLDRVVEAVWARSPLPVVLMLDDVHQVPAGSSGAAALAELLVALPENGHLVLAGRAEPPVPLARLAAEGRATHVDRDDLLLSSAEQKELAATLGIGSEVLAGTGGWPALAQLTATAGRATAERYVWEEVLTAVGPTARRVLAHLVAIGGADAPLASVVVGEPVDLDRILGRAPLVTRHRGERGHWYVPHDLWVPILAIDLDEREAAAARRRAAVELRRQGALRRAGELLLSDPVDDESWPELAKLIIDGSAVVTTLSGAGAAAEWLAAVPKDRRQEPEARLLGGVVARTRGEATRAGEELRAACASARAVDNARVELAALAQLAHVGWWSDDLKLLFEVLQRARELDAATPARLLGEALAADTAQDPAGVLTILQDFVADSPESAAAADFLRARALLALGRAEEAVAIADRAARLHPPLPSAQVQRMAARWQAGRPTEVAGQLDSAIPGEDALPRDRLLTNISLAYGYAYLGRLDAAERRMDDAHAYITTVEGLRPALFAGVVDAIVTACRGDEAAAAGMVAGISGDQPVFLAALRALMAPMYLLNSGLRPAWDAEDLGPDHAEARDAVRTLLDAREGRPIHRRPRPERVLVALGFRWGMELAARTEDLPMASYLVDVCGAAAREVLRDLEGKIDGARRLLRALPTPPAEPLTIRVLGPPALERGGVEISHPDWRRERVRSLLSLLVARRRITRSEAQTALWPDLDEVAGGANLRTTLNYLHRVLEPERQVGDATFQVRADGDILRLEHQHLTVDAWELESHLDAAAAAESAGTPSVALAAYEAALDLWHGDYLEGVYDDWAIPERDRLRARFLAASVRAGELLIAKGEADRALTIATRAVETEPWSEPAHRLSIAAHLARRDCASARRALGRCHAALDEMGAEPTRETVMLERAVLGVPL